MVVKPYKDIWTAPDTRTRTFQHNINDQELVWHQDHYDREITILNGYCWKLQYDNEMPIILQINETYFIPKNTYHRILKGNDNLVISIKEIL